MSEVLSAMKNAAESVDAFLSEALTTDNPHLTELYAAMRYSVLAGGKRLRAFLVLESCRMCGGTTGNAMFYAAALEYLHTYSLIHDDLPAMDDDDLRRGKPTNHKVFGEATAILAGDALLTGAFELIARAPLPAERNARAVAALAAAAGADGMVGGQMMDLAAEHRKPEMPELAELCALKTGALFRAAVQLGAIAAGQEEGSDAWERLSSFASDLGLAFQIRDDLLDEIGTAEELGKNPGSDRADGKTTFLSFFTQEEAEETVKALSERAASWLDGVPGGATLQELAISLADRFH